MCSFSDTSCSEANRHLRFSLKRILDDCFKSSDWLVRSRQNSLSRFERIPHCKRGYQRCRQQEWYMLRKHWSPTCFRLNLHQQYEHHDHKFCDPTYLPLGDCLGHGAVEPVNAGGYFLLPCL